MGPVAGEGCGPPSPSSVLQGPPPSLPGPRRLLLLSRESLSCCCSFSDGLSALRCALGVGVAGPRECSHPGLQRGSGGVRQVGEGGHQRGV